MPDPAQSPLRRARHSRLQRVILAICCALALRSLPARARDAAFSEDLRELTRGPHRLAGSSAGQDAADYIERRLRQLGVREIQPLDMPVWEPMTERCELSVDGHVLRLHPVRPNVIALPVTPEAGIQAPLIYAGAGEYRDYGERRVAGAIVVLDYQSESSWKRAFGLGARAVIWLGQGNETPAYPKHVPVPANQLRFYAAEAELGGVDLRVDRAQVSLHSRLHWRPARGRNLIARIAGTDPSFAPAHTAREALVVAAGYDSFGVVPELAQGARGAANVAALLELAGELAQHPARRDFLLFFLDGQARAQQGAREVYAALQMGAGEAEALLAEQQAQLEQLRAARELLVGDGLKWRRSQQGPRADASRALERALEEAAENARDDVRRQLSVLRLSARDAPSRARLAQLDQKWQRWDSLRRALHEGKLAEFVAGWQARAAAGTQAAGTRAEAAEYVAQFVELRDATRQRFEARLSELQQELAFSRQRRDVRAAFGFDGTAAATWIALHLDLELGGGAPSWGFVPGDYTPVMFLWRTLKSEGDAPGYYGRVLQAIADLEPERYAPSLDPATLLDPLTGATFAAGPFVPAGSAAGAQGIYHLALMTGNDARPRDGHPADTRENLDWQRLAAQAREGGRVLRQLADRAELSLPRIFSPLAQSKYPRFAAGRSEGNYAGLQVSGSLSEDRPAAGALLALWPGKVDWKRQAWLSLADGDQLPGYEPVAFERVNADGRFRLLGLRSDLYEEVMTIGGLFDAQGQLRAITSTEKQTQKLADTMRVNLFPATSGSWTLLPTGSTAARPDRFRLMKASSDSVFPDNRSLWAQQGENGFFYLSDQLVDYRVKLFQPGGGAALGAFSPEHPSGAGLLPEQFRQGINLLEQSAADLWQLNEGRLQTLRERGVTSADLEQLHARSQASLERASKSLGVAERQAAFARSVSLSQRIYQPIRETMDDLVYAIVMLLLLSIPFAFCLERLLVGASRVYGRISGFLAIFLGTFGALYLLHPGFSIAPTPLVIFLAFALMLLSSLVIYIVLRKFESELRLLQGLSAGHQVEVSHVATLLAAIGMGMSTMRRRPLRTLLSALTVVMLTFTILSFASFSQEIGVRSRYEGPGSEQTPASLLVHALDYSSLPRALEDTLAGEQGAAGLLVPHYWLVRSVAAAPRFSVARVDDGRALSIDGVLGVSRAEAERWPELGRALGSASGSPAPSSGSSALERLEQGQIFLPQLVRDVLELEPGDRVLVRGHELTFAGVHDGAALQRLRQLDGQSLLPVDFVSLSAAQQATGSSGTSTDPFLNDSAERAFLHLSSEQVAVTSADVVGELGGSLYAISVHAALGADVEDRARRLAEATLLPVWAATPHGVERLILTRLAQLSGGLALFVPLLLGGLILFGTLLGSISDREREIYTFSALGLSPVHVGMLFFAEAAVYAFVGGVGGQLLAQAVGLGAASLAAAGVIQPVSLNYSSTNSLFATAVVMLTVLVSAIYPAVRASRSANPGVARSWRLPAPEGDLLALTFPFTVSAHDIDGVVSFLAEHFRRHDDAGLGSFAASEVSIRRNAAGQIELAAHVALAPFDLGVTQRLTLTAIPSAIPGVDEVAVRLLLQSGARGDWVRANRVFLHALRRQFLVWRTLSSELIEQYRQATASLLGAAEEPWRGAAE